MTKYNYCLVDMSMDLCIPDYVKSIKPHKSLNTFQRIIVALNLPFIKFNTERIGWEEECQNYDMVILFDSKINYSHYAEKIEMVCRKSTRLILYFWNPVSYSNDFLKLSPRWELATFSKADALKYNMLYVETFYNPQWCIPLESKLTSDVFFIGTEKGRRKIIDYVKSQIEKQGFVTDFKIADNRKALYNNRYSKYLPYSKVISLIGKSRSILEILQKGQTGLSLRCMESLFFNKKIITNNISIKQSPLYSKDRVFIINEDPWDNLGKFLSKPLSPVNKKLFEAYSFDSLIERIYHKQEFSLSK